MSTSKSLLAAALAIAVITPIASATSFTLTPVVSAYYTDTTLTTMGDPQASRTGNDTLILGGLGSNSIYQIDYYANISGLAANQAFDSVTFDAVMSGGLSIPITGALAGGDYRPDADVYVLGSGKSKTTVAVWATSNQDAGPNTNDLQDIVASMGGGPLTVGGSISTDPRNFIAQLNPSGYTGSATLLTTPGLGQYVGSIFLQLNGDDVSYYPFLQIGDGAGDIGMVQYQTVNTSTGVVSAPQFATDTETVTFGTPEPASLGMLAFGSTLLLTRRRRK